MNLQQLRFVCAVVDAELNVSKAALNLFTSQPGISKQIRLLEQELGVELFTRKGKHLSALTPVGSKIVAQARTMLQQAEAITQTAAEELDEFKGSLSIATTHTQSRYMLPPVISKFVQRYPKVTLHMQQGTPLQIAELSARGLADFAIATEALSQFANLVMMPCFRWNRVILLPKEHPLTAVEQLSLAALAQYPLVTYVQGFTGRAKLDQAFLQEGLEPNVVITASDADVIKTYVRQGIGIGIIASMAVEPERDGDLIARDASHLFEWSTTNIGFRRESYLRAYMYEFIALFAPHLNHEVVDAFVACKSDEDKEALISQLKLPSYRLE